MEVLCMTGHTTLNFTLGHEQNFQLYDSHIPFHFSRLDQHHLLSTEAHVTQF